MRNQAANTNVILNSIARPKTRSSLFWWLFDNHAAIAQRAEGRRLDWTELCTTFGDHGLTDLDGKAPTVRTARMTWWRVRKEHARVEALRAAERAERERRAAANPRRDMPSQFRKGDYGPPLATTDGSGEAETPGDDGGAGQSRLSAFNRRGRRRHARQVGSSKQRRRPGTTFLMRTG